MTTTISQIPKIVPPINPANPVNAFIPGFGGMSNSASNIIQSLMMGQPSPSPIQRQNAYFGTGSGMPGSGFVANRGYDLYGEKAEGYQQRGLDNFLKLIQGYSGTVMPTTGQQLQDSQFRADLDFRDRQAEADRELQARAQDFEELRWGKDRPWRSTSQGQVFDRLGKRLRYDPTFDRGF